MTKNVDVIFTNRFTKALDKSGYTRKGFGESIGVTESTVQRWINGTAHPTMNKVQAIADLLNVSPQWLFGANEVSEREKIISSCHNSLEQITEEKNLQTALSAIQAIARGEQTAKNKKVKKDVS